MMSKRFAALLIALSAVGFPRLGLAGIGDQLFQLPFAEGEQFDQFGSDVAISGNWAVVGAPGSNLLASDGGMTYLHDVATGSLVTKLQPDAPAAFSLFGSAVAISDTRAVVGAPGDAVVGRDSGSVYLFEVSSGSQLLKLTPNDGAIDDYFGGAVAISGNIVVIGAPGDDVGRQTGSAYLFDATTGAQLTKLLPNDLKGGGSFGGSVAVSANIAIIGAADGDDFGPSSGAAYLFDITTGAQIAKLLPSDGESSDCFGASVAISGSTAIVGAFNDDDKGLQSGAAYLFDITAGIQIAKLTASDGAMGDQFGVSVAIDGTVAAVGAYGDDDNGSDSGSVYLFDVSTRNQVAKLLAENGEFDDQFGSSVDLDGNTAIVGAFRYTQTHLGMGAAYLFDAPAPVPEPASLAVFCTMSFAAVSFRWRSAVASNASRFPA